MEDKIEIGEYVRTNNKGIRKIDRIDNNKTVNKYLYFTGIEDFEGKEYGIIKTTEIVKHSKQLIDLVEVGDFVNGYRILTIEDSIYENSKRILIYKNQKEKYERWIYIQEYDGKIHTQDDIVEILTKEQYTANCYKVGGENEI